MKHAIEKNNSDKLIECIRLQDGEIKEFEEKSKCTPECRKQCTVPCKALRNMQLAYSESEGAEIILQPMGVWGKQTKEPLAIQYDIMKMEFQPNTNQHSYSSEEMNFICKHIQRFRLNDPQYRTRQLADYIKNIIDNGGIQQEYEYNNIIVKLFSDKLKGKTEEEKVDICSKIYALIFIKL